MTIVGTENDHDDDGFDSVEELFHGKAQFKMEEAVCLYFSLSYFE